MRSWQSMFPSSFKANRRGLVAWLGGIQLGGSVINATTLGGSVEGGFVAKAGNLISPDLGVGLKVDKFEGNTNFEVTVLAGFLGDWVERGLDTPENFIWQCVKEKKAKASRKITMSNQYLKVSLASICELPDLCLFHCSALIRSICCKQILLCCNQL